LAIHANPVDAAVYAHPVDARIKAAIP
jgi:2,5-diketo-D-gluconate reductase A